MEERNAARRGARALHGSKVLTAAAVMVAEVAEADEAQVDEVEAGVARPLPAVQAAVDDAEVDEVPAARPLPAVRAAVDDAEVDDAQVEVEEETIPPVDSGVVAAAAVQSEAEAGGLSLSGPSAHRCALVWEAADVEAADVDACSGAADQDGSAT